MADLEEMIIDRRKYFKCGFCGNVNEIITNPVEQQKKKDCTFKLQEITKRGFDVIAAKLGMDFDETMQYLIAMSNREERRKMTEKMNWRAEGPGSMVVGVPTTDTLEEAEEYKRKHPEVKK